jgi:hypothetical protein
MIVRVFSRLLVLLLGFILVRRSLSAVGEPVKPGGRGQLVTWLGLAVGALLIFGVLRACIGVRL